MCLIIQREPNFEIPFDKFKNGVLNNPDGYGLSFPEGNKLEVLRSAESPDIDKLYRLVNEELIDKKLMIHLRYTTAGATNLRNAHPFPILEKSKDGVDLRMAHNGTLGKYKSLANKGESDTRMFVRSFVRPLFKRLVKGMSVKELLEDDFTKAILEDQLTAASVLTFIDGDGNTLICNETGNGGKKEEGWYYSNTYSFREDYRKPAPVSKGVTYLPPQGVHKKATTPVWDKDTDTPLFTAKHSLSVVDMLRMPDSAIKEVVSDKAESTLLIKELMMRLSKCKQDNRKLNSQVQTLKRKMQ